LGDDEANVPAIEDAAYAAPRISRPQRYARRAGGAARTSRQGPQAPRRL